jgi:hypothetical protein
MTADALWLDDFPPFDPAQPRYQYFIWNKEFDWSPELVNRTPQGGGLIDDIWAGPVIEFVRTVSMDQFVVDRGACLGRGRIYWAQENRHAGFAAWYELVARWVRRTGANLSSRGPACYCLPDALRLWQARQTRPTGPGDAPAHNGTRRKRHPTTPRRRGG